MTIAWAVAPLSVAHAFNQQLESFWKELAAGQSNADITRYEQARQAARSLGYDYILNGDLIASPQEKRLERLEALVAKGLVNDRSATRRAAGNGASTKLQPLPPVEEYESVTKDEVKDLSPDQLRIWRNGRVRAVAQFVNVVGDKPVADLTSADAVEYSEWWRGRVVADEVATKTANKDIGQLSRMLKDISIRRRLNLPGHFQRSSSQR